MDAAHQKLIAFKSEAFPQSYPAEVDILIVDDEVMVQTALKLKCSSLPNLSRPVITSASSIDEALKILSSSRVQVMLLDKNMGTDSRGKAIDGIEFIPEFLTAQSHLQILVVTGMKSFSDCVEAMRVGAFGYIPKDSPDEYLAEQVKRAYELSTLKNQKLRLERGEIKTSSRIEFPGRSIAVEKLRTSLAAVAETNRPVLLVGETGTGKTTAAKWIHHFREEFFKKKEQPFFALNMGAMPANLVESELYGYEKGAFTDAKSSRAGFIELANGGTLFLDEIGEASLDIQTKLLKILEEGSFVRIGGTSEKKSKFKLICATNQNLEQMVAEGKFREDLYMRISTFVVNLPNLTERKSDIPEIIRSVLKKCCDDNSRFVSYEDLPADLIQYLMEHPPRGNVRGIEQFLSRLLVHAPRDSHGKPELKNWQNIRELRVKKSLASTLKPISMEELRRRSIDFYDPQFPGASLLTEEISNQLVLNALESTGTQTEAAKILRITQGLISQKIGKMKSKGMNL